MATAINPATGAVSTPNTLRLRSRAKRTPFWAAASALLLAAVATIGYLYLGGVGGKQFWAAATDLPAGAVLRPTDLVLVHASLSESEAVYLTDKTNLDGQLLTAPLSAGQLVPTGSVASAADAELANLVIQPTTAFSSRIKVGSLVEVWSVAKTLDGLAAAPQRLLDRAEVYRIGANESPLRAAAPAVELRFEQKAVPAVLQALADDSDLMLVARGDLGGQ